MDIAHVRYPNFMIIGAAKAGTTSLHMYLSQHPEIYLPKEKETHFFDWDDLYNKGLDFYLDHFYVGAEKFPARGDATPSYLHLPNKVIPRIQQAFGDYSLRFIVLLRDPIARAWSHYLHMVRIGEETLSFEDALHAEAERLSKMPDRWFGYYRDGLYATQLSAWFDAFGREAFAIHLLDELSSNPLFVLKDICRFLKVSPEFQPVLFRANQAGEARSRLLMRMLVVDIPGKQWLKSLVPPHARRRIRVALRSWNTRPMEKRPRMNTETEVWLRNRYEPSVRELEDLLGRSFEQWRSN